MSIVMPVYGVEKYLDEAVSDALAQTYRRLEVILVDDGSPDSCPEKCDAWAARDGRVRVIHQANGGLSRARNTGMAAAHGDYLYFMDPDDRIEPDLMRACLEAASRYGADLVMFRFDTIAEDGSPMKSSYRHNEYEEPVELTAEQAIRLQVKGDIDSYFWAFLAPRSTYTRQGFSFPEGRKIEDMARICNVIGESTRIVRIPDVLYHYRLRAGSAVHSPSGDLTGDWMQAAQDRREYIIAHYPQLRRFLALQTLNVLGNLNYETMRQSIMFGLRLDPESQQQFRQKVNEFLDDLGDLGEDEGDGLLSGGTPERMSDGTQKGTGDGGDDADDGVPDDARGRFADLLDRVADSLREAKHGARDTAGATRHTVKRTVKHTVRHAVKDTMKDTVVDAREAVRKSLEPRVEAVETPEGAEACQGGSDAVASGESAPDLDGRAGVREALDRLREVFDGLADGPGGRKVFRSRRRSRKTVDAEAARIVTDAEDDRR
ncbi:glycosyltransferase family 2 protein [uncultured Bifidobacterium sp.]|uniref:glycosyltransferase family 2 protein n=1 Tax=uncultured Bifidobacterium sp. TaxID=165187 RepID=UPI0037DC1084